MQAEPTKNLDVDLDAGNWVLDTNDLAKVRLQVDFRDDKPVFVGIARTSDVESFLQGVSHSTVTDVDTSPFEAQDNDHGGDRRPAAPRTTDLGRSGARLGQADPELGDRGRRLSSW